MPLRGFRQRNAWFRSSQLLGPVRNGPVLGMCWDVNPGTRESQRKRKVSLVSRCLQAYVAAVWWYAVSSFCIHHPNSALDPSLESRVWLHPTHLECVNWCTESPFPFLKWVFASLSAYIPLFHLLLTLSLHLAPNLSLLFWLAGLVPPWQIPVLSARTLSKPGLSSQSPSSGPSLPPAMHYTCGWSASDYSPNISQFSLRLQTGSLRDLPLPATTATLPPSCGASTSFQKKGLILCGNCRFFWPFFFFLLNVSFLKVFSVKGLQVMCDSVLHNMMQLCVCSGKQTGHRTQPVPRFHTFPKCFHRKEFTFHFLCCCKGSKHSYLAYGFILFWVLFILVFPEYRSHRN